MTGSQEVTLLAKTIVVSFILGFSGFSVQAQVACILAATDIRFKPFFFARLLHGIYAAVFAFLLFKPLYVSHQTWLSQRVPLMQASRSSCSAACFGISLRKPVPSSHFAV
ncbi:hypothetical protein BSAF29S_02333 [Bacillus safensis subsp. safensis]